MEIRRRGILGITILFSLLAFSTILASPGNAYAWGSVSITTQLSKSVIHVGDSVTDSASLIGSKSASGKVTYNFYNGNECKDSPVFSDQVTINNGLVPDSNAFIPSTPGQYTVQAVYSGDSKHHEAKSTCGSEPLTVSNTSSQVSTTLSRPVIGLGDSVSDLATLTGVTSNAGGIVTYNFYLGNTCTSNPVFTDHTTVTNGIVPPSNEFTPANIGHYEAQAVYSGDSNNQGATNQCGSEPLTVENQNVTPLSTQLSKSEIFLGEIVTDSAIISNATASTSGTVTYNFYSGTSCVGTVVAFSDQVAVTNGLVPMSGPFKPTSPGDYTAQAVYFGDSSHSFASKCGTEPLKVLPSSTTNVTITTQLSKSEIVLQDNVTDSAKLVNVTSNAGGRVAYNFYFENTTCSSNPVFVDVESVTNGVVPNSSEYTPPVAGHYEAQAVYSGDSNNQGTTSTCGSEPLTVANSGGIQITTALSNAEIVLGKNVTDSATLSGMTSNATGTVTYNFYNGTGCSSEPVFFDQVNVAKGKIPLSAIFTPTTPGHYEAQAVYSGDSSNHGTTSICGSEPLSVVIDHPLTTLLSRPDITLGSFTSDSATLRGINQNTTGTVTYNFYNGTGCTGTPVFVNQVDVSEGIIPLSAIFTPSSPGHYEAQAVYSGDSNTKGGTSECGTEPLTVKSPLTTQLSKSEIFLGDNITDTAIITNATSDTTGSVTYNFYSGTSCTGTAVFSDQVVVTNGLVPQSGPFKPTSPGDYTAQAVYFGDSSHSFASQCGTEPLKVKSPTPITISTQLSKSEIVLRENVTDSAKLANATSNAGGLVTYNFYLEDSTCSSNLVFSDQESVTNGTVNNSKSFTPPVIGHYDVQAVYSGDTNNQGIASKCGSEPFTVTPFPSPVKTILSKFKINLGETITDSSTLINTTSDAKGTVTYNFFQGVDCTGSSLIQSSSVNVTNGIVPNSKQFKPTTRGIFNSLVVYSGDSKNSPGNSTCGNEPLIVNHGGPTNLRVGGDPFPSRIKPSFGDVPNMVFHDGLTIDGKVYDLNNYNVDVLKNIAEVGKTLTIVVKHQPFRGPTYWEHVEIGMNFGEKKEFEMYNANLVLSDDKKDGAKLVDPQGYIKDYNATTVLDSNYVYTTFTFTVAKEMSDTNILVSAYDYYHRANYIHVHGAIQFGLDPIIIPPIQPEWIHEYSSVQNADEAVGVAGYYRPHILGHISTPNQMFDNPSQGTIRWFFDEKDETLSRVIYDGNGGVLQSYTEPLEKLNVIPMKERSHSGEHLELWSWQDYQEWFSMLGHS